MEPSRSRSSKRGHAVDDHGTSGNRKHQAASSKRGRAVRDQGASGDQESQASERTKTPTRGRDSDYRASGSEDGENDADDAMDVDDNDSDGSALQTATPAQLTKTVQLKPYYPEFGVFVTRQMSDQDLGTLAGYLNLRKRGDVWKLWEDVCPEPLKMLSLARESSYGCVNAKQPGVNIKHMFQALSPHAGHPQAVITQVDLVDFTQNTRAVVQSVVNRIQANPGHFTPTGKIFTEYEIAQYLHFAVCFRDCFEAVQTYRSEHPSFPNVFSGAEPGRVPHRIPYFGWSTEDCSRVLQMSTLYHRKVYRKMLKDGADVSYEPSSTQKNYNSEKAAIPPVFIYPTLQEQSNAEHIIDGDAPKSAKDRRRAKKAARYPTRQPVSKGKADPALISPSVGTTRESRYPGVDIDQDDEELLPHVKREQSSDNLFVGEEAGNSQDEQARNEGHTSIQDTFAGGHKADHRIQSSPVHQPLSQGAGGALVASPRIPIKFSAGNRQTQNAANDTANEQTLSSADLARFERTMSMPATSSGEQPAEPAKPSDAIPTSMPNNGFIGGPSKKYAADGSHIIHKPGEARTLQPPPSTPATLIDVPQTLAQLPAHVLREQAIRAPTTKEPARFLSNTAYPTVIHQPSSLHLGPVEQSEPQTQVPGSAGSGVNSKADIAGCKDEVKLQEEKDAKLKAKCDEREAEVKRLEEETRKYQELDEAMDDESDEEV
ncbi:hypothetical protein LTS10_010514 [Elasticomyces elasticus]|nr:hypothetical protein LTS10_010514 [Elasticomyces elasticus]